MTEKQFLTHAESCQYLGVHRDTLRRRVSDGLISSRPDRIDKRKHLYARADLDALKLNIPAE